MLNHCDKKPVWQSHIAVIIVTYFKEYWYEYTISVIGFSHCLEIIVWDIGCIIFFIDVSVSVLGRAV